MNNVRNSYSENRFPLWQNIRANSKIAPTFKKSDGETIHMFQLYNLPRETEWQCALTNKQCKAQLERTQILPMAKYTNKQQSL